MATEPVETLWRLWQQEKLPPEKAIGQILQHLLILVMEIMTLQREVARLKKQQANKTTKARHFQSAGPLLGL